MDAEKKKRKDWFFRVLLVILLAVIVFSLYKIGKIVLEYREGSRAYDEISALAGLSEDARNVNFAALEEINGDIRAWLYAEDTPLNYPVVQGEDNDYYLYRMFNRDWNGKGTLFIDYRCERPFEDFNTIIYGHRMKDGSMFHCLTEYRSEEFLQAHPTMRLFTPEATYEVELFAVVTIPADSPLYQIQFGTAEQKAAYLDTVRDKSEVHTEVPVTADDRIVMMSTCTYEYDEARLVVYGKLREKDGGNGL